MNRRRGLQSLAVEVIELNIPSDSSIGFVGDLHMDSSTPSSRIDDYPTSVLLKVADIRKRCQENKVKALFFTGDIFHRMQVTDEMKNMLGTEFLKFKHLGIRVFSISGNHDYPRNNLDAFIKSPLSLLFNFGVLEQVCSNKRVVVNKKGLITPFGFLDELGPGNPKAKYNIMLAHKFYEGGNLITSPRDNLTKDVLLTLGYNCVVLGHDHVNYPIVNVDGVDIIRPGSVARGTIHDYNFTRRVGWYCLKNLDSYSVSNWEFVPIDVKPMKDVVSSAVANKKDNLSDLTAMMSDLVSKLTDVEDIKSDNIAQTVKEDASLPVEVKSMLLRYFDDFHIIY